MMRMAFETGIAHPLHFVVGLQILGNRHGVLAVALHPQREGFNALQQLKGALRGQRRPSVTQWHRSRPTDVRRRPKGFGIDHTVITGFWLVQSRVTRGIVRPEELA